MSEKAVIETGKPVGGLIPTDFDQLWRISTIMAASKMMPKGVDTAEAVFVAVQMGLEIGLSPMQAVQNIAVINGRPSIWGDGALALVRQSGFLEFLTEDVVGEGDTMAAICTAKRKGQPKARQVRFGVDDAKRAGLWGKSGPWTQYPKRMLQLRARSWALRDEFGDVLKGIKQAEEEMDAATIAQAIESVEIPEPAIAPPARLKDKLKNKIADTGDPAPEKPIETPVKKETIINNEKMAAVKCPKDGYDHAKKYCDEDCKDREGCPAWA